MWNNMDMNFRFLHFVLVSHENGQPLCLCRNKTAVCVARFVHEKIKSVRDFCAAVEEVSFRREWMS